GSRPPQPPARSSPARSLHDALPISGLRRPGYAKVAAISRPAVRMSPSRSALIVDDERDIRELLVLTLGRMGLRVDTAVDVASAKAQLAQDKYDLCLTDMRLPDGSGQELIELIAQRYPELPVAMITAYGNVEAAVNALKAG